MSQTQTVLVNDYQIEAENLKEVVVKKEDQVLKRISFNFKVTHEDYHDVTTLLYKNDFSVLVPERNVEFQATITNYSSSITNLYVENTQGDFRIELTEKNPEAEHEKN